MPDLWDTNPDHVFSPPDAQPDPTPSDYDDHSQKSGSRMTAASYGSPPMS
jgi:hypothetical protein